MAQSGEFLRGHTDTIILRLLIDKDSYGYEISNNITELGQGLIEVKDATIYTAFRRMEKEVTLPHTGRRRGRSKAKVLFNN